MSRWALVAAVAAVPAALCSGTAHADEANKESHNGPRVALINMGQVDDPMEDVLEHTLNFGDGYRWS
ncbi:MULTISPECIES: hypothetical protein [Streptomyces]|uniref:hypothetical protein n=1 Tax=Streptomyces TaxID=1883 RepID=UPI001E42499E|nr:MULTISPECIES: hypothetical protein [Streptomyces]UFQ20393.1 hypothetical protein J2N69_28520 [Streptomyces huasconensis]WCL90002.1 hypothetical protein PPN52_28505 [Streptomyces sp. JCM 35825]